MIEEAMQLASQAHAGQTDKGGKPYIFHCLRVMQHFDDEFSQCVAVLHDVLEDTKYTDYYIFASCGTEVCEGVKVLSKYPKEKYADYISRVAKADSRVIHVKLADLADNSNLDRLPKPLTEKDIDRQEKYLMATLALNKVLHQRGEHL